MRWACCCWLPGTTRGQASTCRIGRVVGAAWASGATNTNPRVHESKAHDTTIRRYKLSTGRTFRCGSAGIHETQTRPRRVDSDPMGLARARAGQDLVFTAQDKTAEGSENLAWRRNRSLEKAERKTQQHTSHTTPALHPLTTQHPHPHRNGQAWQGSASRGDRISSFGFQGLESGRRAEPARC